MTNHIRPPETLLDLLTQRAELTPEKRAYIFLTDGETEETTLTYHELDAQARTIAAHLQTIARPGERALLLYPSGLEYLVAFFGCLYAGVVAVPCYPPRRNRPDPRLRIIAADARASVILTVIRIFSERSAYTAQYPSLQTMTWLATDQLSEDPNGHSTVRDIGRDTLAFLQYTSGSTSAPKGAMLTHGNLIANEAMIQQAFGHTEQTILAGWLPLFHDMGLIGTVLQPLYMGIPAILFAPEAFLQKPVRWLQVISRYRVTTSGGPNFAYELCVEKISPEQRAGLDLRSWDVAFNGSEPVRAETLERFAQIFEPCGFRRAAFYPCYGMAEASLFISGCEKTAVPTILSAPSKEQSPTIQDHRSRLVGCGHSWGDQQIMIVNPETQTQCREQQEGEIWVSGSHIASGYWNQLQETEQTFHAFLGDTGEGPFLRTGDLGFLKDGEIFVTGRLKDLIIIRGQNYYPQDIEQAVEQCHPDLRGGSGAAFSIERDHEERLVVVQEVKRTALRQLDAENVIETIRQAVAEQFDIQIEAVALLKPGRIPKTTSGKVQRRLCRKQFLENSLDTVSHWQQPRMEARQHPLAEGAQFPSMHFLNPSPTSPRRGVYCPDIGTLRKWLLDNISRRIGLNADDIDPQKPLVLYGVDSATALALAGELSEWLARQFPPTLAYDYPTIDALAGYIAAELHADQPVQPPETPVQRETTGRIEKHFPLSYGQQALWRFYQERPDSSVYNVGGALRIAPCLAPKTFQDSIRYVFNRHPMLRSMFSQQNGTPVHLIRDEQGILIEQIDASNMMETRLRRLIQELFFRPLDLIQGPAYRVSLISCAKDEYIFLFVMHHLIVDAWSLEIIVTEILSAYAAFLDGKTPDLPVIQTNYQSFVQWQNELLNGEQGERLWRYWRQQLSGDLPILNLPTDRPYPAQQSYHGGTQAFMFSEDVITRLRTLAQTSGTTLYTVLLAAFQIFLHRYSGQDDIVIGSPVTGRSQADFRPVVGYFVNLLALRARFDENVSFRQFLEETGQTVRDALAHQDYPFPLLVQRLGIRRDMRRFPVFQVIFVFQKEQRSTELLDVLFSADADTAQNNELNITHIDLPQQEGLFDLTLEVFDTGTTLSSAWKYRTDIFDEPRISRIANHFDRLLKAIVKHSNRSIRTLPLLTEQEQHQILYEWNDTAVKYPPEGCLHKLFEHQAEYRPDAIAISFEGQHVSYADLNRRANQLAHYLQSLGAVPDAPVGICVERSPDMIIALLGILKAGAAYLPLDPAYPTERLNFMLDDAQVPIVITQIHLLGRLPATEARILCLEREQEIYSQFAVGNPESDVTPGHLAYIMYTSGSTGKPKGVMVEHRGVCNLAQAQIAAFGVEPESRVLQFASLSFDASISEIALALCSGAQLCLAPQNALLPGPSLERLLHEQRITHVTLPPTALKVMSPKHVSTLTHLIVAGEVCSPELAEQWATGRRFFNAYGPTETTVCATIYEGKMKDSSERLPIGTPIANMQVYLLDQHLQPVPVGVAGELYIGGAGVSRGYLHRPDLTEERFIPHPFNDRPGERLYKTGDLARYLSDGNIEFLGRIDHQVKIRGFRIELGEIESVLAAYPAVNDQIVMVRENQEGEKQLTAYLVSTQDRTTLISELRQSLRQSLPEYMIPAAFVVLEQFPLTPNGKVDRQTLARYGEGHDIVDESQGEPRAAIERTLSEIWRKILHVEQINIHSDFFESGGHSLNAVRLLVEVEQQFGQSFSLESLFEAPTIAEFARLLKHTLPSQAFTPLVSMQAANGYPPFFCVHPADGSVFHLSELASRMADHYTFYGLQAFGLDPYTSPLNRIEEMAAAYLQHIRDVYPAGPYLLGGYSSGGVITLEMAQQLRQQGEQTPLVILLDSVAPHILARNDVDDASEHAYGLLMLAYMVGNLHDINLLPVYAELRGLAPDWTIDVIQKDMQQAGGGKGRVILEQAARQAGILDEKDSAYLQRIFEVLMAHLRAIRHYSVPPYDGRIILFRTQERIAGLDYDLPDYHHDSTSGWGAYSFPLLEVNEVPGHHFSFLQPPYVDELARKLLNCLQQI